MTAAVARASVAQPSDRPMLRSTDPMIACATSRVQPGATPAAVVPASLLSRLGGAIRGSISRLRVSRTLATHRRLGCPGCRRVSPSALVASTARPGSRPQTGAPAGARTVTVLVPTCTSGAARTRSPTMAATVPSRAASSGRTSSTLPPMPDFSASEVPHRHPAGARAVCASEPRGSTCASARPVAMSRAAIRRPTAMPPSTHAPAVIPSSDRSSPARTGCGAMSTRCSSQSVK